MVNQKNTLCRNALKQYLLRLVEKEDSPSVELKHSKMLLTIRISAGEDKKQTVLDEWYRSQLRIAVPPVIAKWEPLMSVRAQQFFVQRMRTKWGSCNTRAASIRLNT